MRIVKLTKETTKNILENMLKRSPSQYGEYESRVQAIIQNIKENGDGTVTLTVEAVCDTVICDDAVITHELTVRFAEDGSFQYLGNEILNDGIMHIPDYQYRIKD